MNTKKYFHLVWVLSAFFALAFIEYSAEGLRQQPAIVQEAVKQKVAALETAYRARCAELLRERAIAKVDTILMQKAQEMLQDSSTIPSKPIKPARPSLKPSKDGK